VVLIPASPKRQQMMNKRVDMALSVSAGERYGAGGGAESPVDNPLDAVRPLTTRAQSAHPARGHRGAPGHGCQWAFRTHSSAHKLPMKARAGRNCVSQELSFILSGVVAHRRTDPPVRALIHVNAPATSDSRVWATAATVAASSSVGLWGEAGGFRREKRVRQGSAVKFRPIFKDEI
jgi:hypothetical protein